MIFYFFLYNEVLSQGEFSNIYLGALLFYKK